MTKYFEEQKRRVALQKQKADIPIAISGEHTKEDKKTYYCNYCQYKMVKISDDEWHCNHCNNSAYPEVEQLRSKSKITTPLGLHMESLVAYPPEPDDLTKKPVEVKGGLAELKRRGIRITSYKEEVG